MINKLLLILILLFSSINLIFGQENNCTTAVELFPDDAAQCGDEGNDGEGGFTPVVSSDLSGITPSNPYPALANCNGGGDMTAFANDTWFRFEATANILNVEITNITGMSEVNIGFYTGNCAGLTGLGCAKITGSPASVSESFEPLSPGTTYYILVSGAAGEEGAFDLSISNDLDCSDCFRGYELTVDPLPLAGTYSPGDEVDFCLTVTDYEQISSNWFHGVQVDLVGDGWDGNVTNQVAPPSCSGNGQWLWYDRDVGGYGPGFYFLYDGFAEPEDYYGDNNAQNCNPTFCWTATVDNIDPSLCDATDPPSLAMNIGTTADGESGSWTSVACTDDPSIGFSAIIACCPSPELTVTPVSCFGFTDGAIEATIDGSLGTVAGDYVLIFYDEENNIVTSETITIASDGDNIQYTLTDLPAGEYSVVVSNPLACVSGESAVVAQPEDAVGVIVPDNMTICNFEDINETFTTDPEDAPGTFHFTWTSTLDIGFGTSGTTTGDFSFTTNSSETEFTTAIIEVVADDGVCPGVPNQFQISLYPSPIVSIAGDPMTGLCPDDEVALTGTFVPEIEGIPQSFISTNIDIPGGSDRRASTTVTSSGINPENMEDGQLVEICFTVASQDPAALDRMELTIGGVVYTSEDEDPAPAGTVFNQDLADIVADYTSIPPNPGTGQVPPVTMEYCMPQTFLDMIEGAGVPTNADWSLEVWNSGGGSNNAEIVEFRVVINDYPEYTFEWSPTTNLTGEFTGDTDGEPLLTTFTAPDNDVYTIELLVTDDIGCEGVGFIDINVACGCDAESGEVQPIADICPGGTINAEVVGNYDEVGFTTLFILVDSDGIIVSKNETGEFTLPNDCNETYSVYSYNFEEASDADNDPTGNIDDIDCVPNENCCNLSRSADFFVGDTDEPSGDAPDDVTVECIDDVPAVNPVGVTNLADNCTAVDDLVVTYVSDVTDGETCPETITRTYRITDECGNTHDVTQTITVNDEIDPSGDAPANTTVDCVDDVPAVNTAGLTNLSDNCTALGDLSVTYVSDVSNDEVCNNEEIIRTYRITDECDNTFDVTQTITISAVSPTFDLTGTDPTVCGDEDGSITLSDLDANTDYEFSYDGGTVSTITTNGDGEYVINDLGAGTYTDFSVALANCTTCETIDDSQISLSDPNPPIFTVMFGSHPTTCGGTDGSILIDGDGTLDPNTEYELSYSLDGTNVGTTTIETDADGNYTIDDLSQGNYTGFSLALDGCTGSQPGPIALEDPEAPTAVPSTTTAEICVGDDILLFAEAVAGATYSWTGPNGYTSSDQNPEIGNASTLNSGDYTLVVTTNNCPSAPEDVTVTVTEYPDLQITNPDAVCSPNTVDITSTDVTAGSSNSDNLTYWEDAGATITLDSPDAVDESGTYYIQADNNGCAVVEEVVVSIIETPTYSLSGQDPSICNAADGIITILGLENNESYDITYSDDGGVTTTDITENSDGSGEITIEDLLAGDYEVTLTLTGTSCEGDGATITLNNPGAPQIDSFDPVVACDSYTVPSITGTDLTGDETFYDQSGGPTEGNEVTVGTVITSSTTLYAYDADGDCSDEEVLVITINNTPAISGPVSIEGCDPVEMPAVEGDNLNDPAYYTEANGQGERINVGETVSYEDFDNYPTTLYIYDETGTSPNCSSGEEVTLIINELPTASILNVGDEYCENDTPDNITVTVTGSPDWEIEYTIDGVTETATGSESPITLDNSEGDYELVSISDENCTANASGSAAIVYTPTPPAPNAGQDVTYCSTNQLENMFANASSDGELNWYLDPMLEDYYQSGEQVIPQLNIGETTYYVTETVNGCEGDYAQVIITIEDCEIIIPTAITPDGDGNNDVWQIPSLDDAYPNNTVRIYNRWGNQIFEHDSSSQGPYNENPWDGSFKGEILPVGSYFFIIEFNDEEQGSESGAISIILD